MMFGMNFTGFCLRELVGLEEAALAEDVIDQEGRGRVFTDAIKVSQNALRTKQNRKNCFLLRIHLILRRS
jgi:hypothetical protein